MLIVFFVLFFFFTEQSNMIVNTAILTNQPVSLPVVVLAVSHDGTVSDVTSAVTCQSTNESTVKVCGLFFFCITVYQRPLEFSSFIRRNRCLAGGMATRQCPL